MEKSHKDIKTQPTKPIWRGQIGFGLINIPVTLFSAEKHVDLHFHLLDNRNLSTIHYQRINDTTGEEVPWENIVKGYEYEKDSYVVIPADDLQNIIPENTQTIAIEDFVHQAEVSPVYFEKPYYLTPAKGGEKGYVLLREILANSHKVGIATVVIRTKQHLAALMPYKKGLVLNLLRFNQELRSTQDYEFPEETLTKYKISKKEMEIAKELVNMMSTTWQPEKYHDTFHEVLMNMIVKNVKKGKTRSLPQQEKHPVKASNVVDFMELLKKSVKETEHLKKRRKKT